MRIKRFCFVLSAMLLALLIPAAVLARETDSAPRENNYQPGEAIVCVTRSAARSMADDDLLGTSESLLTLSGHAGGGAVASQRVLDSTNQECQKIIDTLNNQLAGLTPQKAVPAVLNGVTVEYNGASKPISDAATITVEQGNVLVVTPHDVTTLGNIEKAVRAAGIGVTPENDGKRVTLTFPRLTGELRNERLKEIANIEEQAKIQIRDVRKAKLNEIKEMARSGEITPDKKNDIENKLQRTVDEYNNQVQEIVKAKKDQVIER